MAENKLDPFADPPLPRKTRAKWTAEKLEQRASEQPKLTYQGTDDDLPISLWPEPDFDVK